MTLSDVSILGKKILVGIIVTLVPFIIIFGGLWLTPKLLSKVDKPKRQESLTLKTKTVL
jgi:heme/copper-type cytochrome/quinol oxidase subunit 2